MDTALISALSALGGSVIGGLTTGLTTWLSLRAQARTGHRLHHVAQREELYRDFIITASRMFGDSMLSSEPKIQEGIVLYGMVSRMRILSSSPVIECAERTIDSVLDSYFAEKRTIREIRELMKRGEAIDPLRAFSEVTREELRTF